jgi:hypothetical protein
VPYGTNENNLIPDITLKSKSPKSKIERVISGTAQPGPASGVPIPFQYQEAIYRVTAEDEITTQDYVVVVSENVAYYYVNGTTGSDTWPDIYNGGSETQPFKTLAYAVYRASWSDPLAPVDHIFITGKLDNASENGAFENAAISYPDGFTSSGSTSGSVFTLNGTNGKKITVTGVGNGATLQGTTGKRVLSITGGAELVFENITVTGGNAPASGDGGGIYISGNSKVKFSGGGITGNTAAGSGGGVYVEGSGGSGSEFTIENASISGNTALGASTDSTNTASAGLIALTGLAGGGGVCVSGDALFWMASGTIANNAAGTLSGSTAKGGSGGGVLVRGTLMDPDYDGTPGNFGFIMSSGTISGNKSYGASSPHGGGGVYVASGEFDMIGGSITQNYSKRQGGGVFVHSAAVFNASGNSTITGNDGVGSSKGICSRGVTELTDNAQADTIYVWNPLDEDGGIDANTFSLVGNAKVGGIVLAHSTEHRNFIYLGNITGTGQIGIIDLEGHLTPPSYSFVDTDINDWLNQQAILRGNSTTVTNNISRFPLGTFVGGSTISLSSKYKIGTDTNLGKLVKK